MFEQLTADDFSIGEACDVLLELDLEEIKKYSGEGEHFVTIHSSIHSHIFTIAYFGIGYFRCERCPTCRMHAIMCLLQPFHDEYA